jgi:phage gp36-like protein
MDFILIDDLTSKIKSSVLSDTLQITNIIKANDPILVIVEKDSIELLRSYLSNKFDVNSILSQTGDNRNRLIVNIICDIMIYELLVRLASDVIPEVRETKYERTLKILTDLRDGKLTIDIPETNMNYDNSSNLLWSSDISNHMDY